MQFSLLKAIQEFPPGRGEFAKMISEGAKALLTREASAANRRLVVHLARTQRLAELEPEVLAAVSEKEASGPDLIEAVKALREIGSARVEVFQALIRRDAGPQSDELHREALTALASAKSNDVVPAIAGIWPQLSPSASPDRTRQAHFIQGAGVRIRQSAAHGKRFRHGRSRRRLVGQARHGPRCG